MEQKIAGFCWTLDFSFPNFVGVGLGRILMFIFIRSDSKSRKTQSSAHLWYTVHKLW